MKKNEHRKIIMDILESIVSIISKNEESINDLNVFPVPDGDTGSNMLATLVSAWGNVSEASTEDVEVLHDFARGALLGARGNSGVIVSQIIKGFAEGVKKVGGLSFEPNDLRIILRTTKEYAYNAVSNPVEGTILSVVRALDEKYERNFKGNLLSAFKEILKIAKEATANTPNQLNILEEAGVVDSGAYGLTLIIESIIYALDGKPLKLEKELDLNKKKDSFRKADPIKNIGYCTEFILTLKEPSKFDRSDFERRLVKECDGDSLVLIVEEDILKVHIHVKKPGNVFNLAQDYGQFSMVKSENMASQAEGAGHFVEGSEFIPKKKKINHKELAIISVSNGEGLNKVFKKAGANKIVSGGQSMNPSVEDFIELIDKLNYKNIVLLPNNSNIILTAETVKKLVDDKNVFVLPTKTLQQGLVALYNINKEMYNFHDFENSVIEAINSVREGQVTISIRNTEMNGLKIKKGDFISIKRKEIISSTKTFEESAVKLIDKILEFDIEVITLIYNDFVNEKQINRLKKHIINKNSEIEIDLIYGGQAVYHLLVLGEK